ncbi:MAG: hypothetical protein ACKOC5_00780 [Chloroflexota bacterium]
MQPTPSPTTNKYYRAGVIALIVLGLLMTFFFGMRAVRQFMRVRGMPRDPGLREVEMIRGWMTIPHIAHGFKVPEQVLYDALGVSAEQAHDQSLADINQQFFPGQPGEAVTRVQEAVRKYLLDNPPPLPPGHQRPPGDPSRPADPPQPTSPSPLAGGLPAAGGIV